MAGRRLALALVLAGGAVVAALPADADPVFVADVIATGVDETHTVRAADFDGDGDIDAFSTDYVDGLVLWHRNDGSGTFTTLVVDPNLEGAYPGHISDLDQDGDIDILAAGYLADTVAWYENDGAASFSKRIVDAGADGAHSVVTGDMDGDGDLDLLTTNQDGGQVVWYENDGAEGFGSPMVIDQYPLMTAKRAEFVDMDSDGDMDVVAGHFGEPPVPSGEVAWYENEGSEVFTKHVIIAAEDFEGVYSVFPYDMDLDGDQDVLAVSQRDNTVALFVNNGSQTFTRQVIDSAALALRTVRAADLDADGLPDVLTASVDDDTVAWYRNDGTGGFTKSVIDAAALGAYGLYAADVDLDGDLDVLSAQRDSGNIVVYYQQGTPAVTTDLVVLVEPGGEWHLRYPNGTEYTFFYGNPGDQPLMGDWNGDGLDTPGMFRPATGFVYLTNALPPDGGVGVADAGGSFFFGAAGDQVLVGDWDGNGTDTLGIHRREKVYLTNVNATSFAQHEFFFGRPGDVVFGGDANGDGADSIFLYRPDDGLVYFTNDVPIGPSAPAFTAGAFHFGSVDDEFVVGDWDADGIDTVGIFRPSDGTVHLRNENSLGFTDVSYIFGEAGWLPVAGAWN